jgi:ATP-dependent Clp protease, protease subunit
MKTEANMNPIYSQLASDAARAMVPMVIETDGRGERAFDIYSLLLRNRIVFLGTPINDQVANVIVAQLLFLNSEDPEKDINFYINSPGGQVTSGLAIYDTMQMIQAPVSTTAVGMTASFGTMLLLAGTKGKRYALPNATIHLHQPLGGAQGQASDIEIQANEILRLKKLLNGMIMRHSTMTEDVVLKYTDRDYYMTSELAKQHGLIDEILLPSASKLNLLNQVVQPAAALPKP